MRDEAPLYCNEKYDFFALSRFDDVEAALGRLEDLQLGEGLAPRADQGRHRDAAGHRSSSRTRRRHDLHRGLLSRVFTPKRMNAIEPKVREFCARSLDPLVGTGGFDFIADLGAQMPMRTIGMLLGIPEQDQEAIRDQDRRGPAARRRARPPDVAERLARPTSSRACSPSTSTGGPSTPPTT